jgi:hypothetical protein
VGGQPQPIVLAELKEQGSNYGTTWLDRLQSLFGIFVLLTLCWLMSSNRRNIPWRVIGWGIGF